MHSRSVAAAATAKSGVPQLTATSPAASGAERERMHSRSVAAAATRRLVCLRSPPSPPPSPARRESARF